MQIVDRLEQEIDWSGVQKKVRCSLTCSFPQIRVSSGRRSLQERLAKSECDASRPPVTRRSCTSRRPARAPRPPPAVLPTGNHRQYFFLQSVNLPNVSGEQSIHNGDRCNIDDFLDLRSRLKHVNGFGHAHQVGANRLRPANTRQQFVTSVGGSPIRGNQY
jgi:hypothetical protein